MSKRNARFTVDSSESLEGTRKLSKKRFTSEDLISFKPKTDKQRKFFESYYSNTPIIAQIGAAGTGKTSTALYCALSSIFSKSEYHKVVVVRSAVQTREIGFLPGTEEEGKNDPYEQAFHHLCNELITYKSDNYKNLKALKILDFKNTSFLRGLTFNNTIVIMDEAQSCTYHELSTVTTRLGHHSRLILCGDTKQDDLGNARRKEKSGLESYLKVLNAMPYGTSDIIQYGVDDIVRSGIVRDFLRADYSFTDL